MRRLLFAGVLLLAACGDKQEVSQSSGGDFSPNQVAGRDAIQNVNVQNATINMSPEMLEKLAQALKAQGVPADQLNAQLEELKRKYADLEQRLGEYAKTDELAQQARRELDLGNLDQAETLLQQAYDKDFQLTRERLAQRAFDLAEVAELRLDHDKALARYREVTQLQPDNVSAWWELAKIAQKLGNTTQALDAWRGMQQAAKTQQQEREFAVAISGEADILKANGDSKTAKEKFLQAHESLKKAAAAEPDNTARQRDLSVIQASIGDLYVASGDHVAALKSYQDSHEILTTLVELDPKQTQWQHELSINQGRIGDLYVANGDHVAALKSYQDSHEILTTLVELDPKQTQWQHGLSIIYERIGDLYVANDERAAALKSYQDSLSIRKTLVELDPKQAQWQRGLSVIHDRIGDLYVANGDRAAALKSYQDSLSIGKTLVELDSKQTQWQRDLSVSYNNMGDLYVANGNHAAALKSYQDSHEIFKKLVELDPNVVEWQTDVVASYYRMAEMQPAKANEFMHKSLDILQKLHDSKRLPKDWEQWLEITKERLK